MESVGAELLVPPNTVGARVERVTHTGHRVNTVFAIFRLVRAFNLNMGDNSIISLLNVPKDHVLVNYSLVLEIFNT